jgi:glycosyltransferase involved in cell wall biosynthesis
MSNIVHFGKYYFPHSGGIESVTLSLSKGAVGVGHNVSVICFQNVPVFTKEILDGVSISRVPIRKLIKSQPISFKYFWCCLLAAKKADIVHLHAPNMLGAFCALFINKKICLLVHWHSDVINKGLLGALLRPLEYALLSRANNIVVTSEIYANASVSLAPFKNKITVVPIGVPDKKHQVNGSSMTHELERKIDQRRIILSVGRLVSYKGFEVLIHAAKHLSNDAVVVIVGGGPLQAELENMINHCGIKDRVLLVGRLSEQELHALFERATLFCLPSTYRSEAFGVVLLEAMTFGLPIVATDIPGSGVPWVNLNGISGLNVPVGDPVALAQACNQIMSSPELRRRLSDGARQRFLAEFTDDVSVKRMMHLYDRMLAIANL